jgi:WD40 repeat protein
MTPLLAALLLARPADAPKPVAEFADPQARGPTAVGFDADGKALAVTTDGVGVPLKLWDVASGKELRRFEGHVIQPLAAAFSADGKLFAAAGIGSRNARNAVPVWEVATGKPVARLPADTPQLHTVAFSPDGKRLATGGYDRTVTVWDLATGKPAGALPQFPAPVQTVAFSADGKRLAAGAPVIPAGGEVRVWDAATFKEVVAFRSTYLILDSVAFSPDGKALAVAVGDRVKREGVIELRDVATGKLTATLKGHDGRVWVAAFHPNGKLLASGGSDQTARLWDLATGKLLATFPGHASRVTNLAFSPDGKRLAAGTTLSGSAKVWDIAAFVKE